MFEFCFDIPLPLLLLFFCILSSKIRILQVLWPFCQINTAFRSHTLLRNICRSAACNFTFSVFCIHVLVFLVIFQKSDWGCCAFLWNHGARCHRLPCHPPLHPLPPPGRGFALPMCLSNEISLFRLNSRCCSVSWWCLHGQFVPIFPRNGAPLPGPAEGQWGQHCQPGLRNGRQLHCHQRGQQ